MMIIKYNSIQLNRIIEDIFILTGVSISVLDVDGNTVAAYNNNQKFCSFLQTVEGEKKQCMLCDQKILHKCRQTKKLEHHMCRTGLYDSAMPIIKNDNIVGHILLGQIRSVNSPQSFQYNPTVDPKSSKKLARLYKEVPFLSEKCLGAMYDLLPHVFFDNLFDNLIKIIYDPFTVDVINFIDANLNKKITVDMLCSKFCVSKNYLYGAFKKNLNNTVIGYINEKRMAYAKKLLKQSNDTVYKIAEKTGINNYTYFCKLFKKLNGVTPSQYKHSSVK